MRARRALALACGLALGGCAQDEPAELATDGGVTADFRTPGVRPAGAACAVHHECRGACLEDPLGGGRRCFDPCDEVGECPVGQVCVSDDAASGCVPAPALPNGLGEPCEQTACEPELACSPDHPDGLRCARPCAGNEACELGERCAPEGVEPRVCLPPTATVFGCPFTPCERADLLCVEEVCVAPCVDRDVPCPGGGLCTPREGDGALYCAPTGDVTLGGSCASGQGAACVDGLECVGEGPGDPDAVCSLQCDAHADCEAACDGCEAEVACRRGACVPAPFGRGAEAAGAGEGCAEHGDTDCLPALNCVPAGELAWCAESCDEGRCPVDFECVADWCLPLADGPAPCAEGGPCASVGDPCPETGPAGCASALCAPRPDTGESVCSARCDEGECPPAFVCEPLETGRFCFPAGD